MKTQDAVVFITGASRGLGLAFARECVRRGARKVYAGVRTPNGSNTPGIEQVPIDVTNPASIMAAASKCGDTTMLINNAGIARITGSMLDSATIDVTREVFETNYYGTIRVSQAFASILATNGGGAMINVLSDAVWHARPFLAGYSASKSAEWSFTNALRIELRSQKTLVLGLHVSFIDTDLTKGFDMKKIEPRQVAEAALDGVEAGKEEVLVDDFTRQVKRSLGEEQSIYLNPPDIG
ncbi:MAG: SDR family oxidoreductase [Verrucomicrobia subdivision 3 bacterium]|nr:SDR family oxidoreductase [Limisphaerales bacterium]